MPAFKIQGSITSLSRSPTWPIAASRPDFAEHGSVHSIYFDDPDGHKVELTTYEV